MLLELHEVGKLFEGQPALRGVSFEVEAGEIVVVLGPSGCGKTTLLRTISGFAGLDEGQIILDGEDVTNVPPNGRDTAMVFQAYALFPHMTVAQNIGFGLRIRKRPQTDIDDEVERLLYLVQMEGLGKR